MMGRIARSVALGGILAAAASLTLMAGESSKPAQAGTPVITDWSHSHLIFSQPRTPNQAARLQKDIRYQQQQARHTPHPPIAIREGSGTSRFNFWSRHHRRGRRMHRDWSVDLGPGATVGAGRFPAKYTFSNSVASCASVLPAIPDFVVFGTSVSGAGVTSIGALTNLYAGCSGQVPGSFWAYDTGGQVLTSPVISLDGTQVAFTQTSGTTSSLVVLKWAAFVGGSFQNPTTLSSTAAASYPTCAAPCMTVLPLTALDSNSSVFYDYGSDMAWVGDDSGKLHQFTGIFKGTPTESSSPWPIALNGGAALTSTVHDDASGNTFVGDQDGFLYRVDGTGAPTQSAQLDFGTGLSEAPMVDSTAGTLYVFSSNDGAGSPSAGVFQLSTSFATGAAGTEVTVGAASNGTTPLYNGTFDHSYITATTPTGNIYVCGNPGAAPTLYQIPIAGGVMGTPLAGPIVSTTTESTCSPVTDVYNAIVTGAGLPQEWVFLGTQAVGSPSACQGHACAMSFKVTSWLPGFTYNLGQEVLDSNFNIQVAENSGFISGATHPVWNNILFGRTKDNGVYWRNQGPVLSAPPNGVWAPTTSFTGGEEIIDSHNNIEIAQLGGGTSGATQPTWPLGEGVTTIDGTVTWYNIGANPVAGLPASGGTSGIIMDNTIINPGGSQVYFTNLQDTGCFTSGGNGGCAVQASQQGLN